MTWSSAYRTDRAGNTNPGEAFWGESLWVLPEGPPLRITSLHSQQHKRTHKTEIVIKTFKKCLWRGQRRAPLRRVGSRSGSPPGAPPKRARVSHPQRTRDHCPVRCTVGDKVTGAAVPTFTSARNVRFQLRFVEGPGRPGEEPPRQHRGSALGRGAFHSSAW